MSLIILKVPEDQFQAQLIGHCPHLVQQPQGPVWSLWSKCLLKLCAINKFAELFFLLFHILHFQKRKQACCEVQPPCMVSVQRRPPLVSVTAWKHFNSNPEIFSSYLRSMKLQGTGQAQAGVRPTISL